MASWLDEKLDANFMLSSTKWLSKKRSESAPNVAVASAIGEKADRELAVFRAPSRWAIFQCKTG